MNTRKKTIKNLLKFGVFLLGISLLLWNCEKEEYHSAESIEEITISIQEIQKKFRNEFKKDKFTFIQSNPIWENAEKFNDELGNFYIEIPFQREESIDLKKSSSISFDKLLGFKNDKNQLVLRVVHFFTLDTSSYLNFKMISHKELIGFSGFVTTFNLNKQVISVKEIKDGVNTFKKIKYKEKTNNDNSLMSREDEPDNATSETICTRTCWYEEYSDGSRKYFFCGSWVCTDISYSATGNGGSGGGSGANEGSTYTTTETASITVINPDYPINDILKFIECFDTTKPAKLTIYVDQPVSNSNIVASFSSVGHAFIGISQGDNSSTFGFYPNSPTNPWSPEATPIFGDDNHHSYDVSLTLDITASQLEDIIKLTKDFNDNYDLNNNNCTDFAIQIGNKAGLNLPECNSSWGVGGGSNPAKLGQYLRSSYIPVGSERDTNGGSSPSNKKDC